MDIVGRLKKFIASTGLQTSQFADRAGIPRPTLSQLLSGRNKKVSNELIDKLHLSFPRLNVLWLLFGEGDMDADALAPTSEPQNADFPAQQPDSEQLNESTINSSEATKANRPTSAGNRTASGSAISTNPEHDSDLYGPRQDYRATHSPVHPTGAPNHTVSSSCAADFEDPVPYGKSSLNSPQASPQPSSTENANSAYMPDCPGVSAQLQRPTTISQRQIAYIMVCYTDSSFEIFNPSDSLKKQQ